MPVLPLLFNVQGRLCLVVGGGAVGQRKARVLRDAGAQVRLVSPELSGTEELAGVEILRRPFLPSDLDGVSLTFAAAGERSVNASVAREARQRHIPVNVADRPEEGDFTLPAILRRGELTVAIGTGGASPALAALVRDRLGQMLGPEWETVLRIAAALRQKGLTPPESAAYNSEILRHLLDEGLPALLAGGDADGIDRLLQSLPGSAHTLAELGVTIPKGKR